MSIAALLATVGSAVSLCVFVLVAVAGFRLRKEIRAHAWPLVLASLAAGFVLVVFAVDTLRNEPGTFIAMAVLIVLELRWKWFRDRRVPAPRAGTRTGATRRLVGPQRRWSRDTRAVQ